ncbi:MAG: hypothetical protein A3D35_03590 [Candidatus Staskawiczbacteria bacterium RIFCSPHIGHO2_02_FULL_34_9]|uniref:Uncharacterized protein n=1 Tax=Candidatus Staskawiczbacteria bacterium RIFCSPHIGHO2_02_FULL_34_9 TaxID=1802206 RepID=A0A1G2HXP0_9BACT|nr:MAG: hypothetical protein A3D35_03590 [Candidatus Staskawiczbacteria bacterium RIFCSPHIGHO2_02_FULL_34_9]
MDTKNLNKNLKRLAEISEWFNSRKDVNLEEDLKIVKEASILIKESREQLKEVENSFEEIKKEIESEKEVK